MNQLMINKIRMSPVGRFAFPLITAVTLFSPLVVASLMSQEEFFQLVKGDYEVVSPTRQRQVVLGRKVSIYMKDGEIYLENDLAVTTKSQPALYKVSNFECYNHSVPSSSCDFRLKLEDPGSAIHFLGMTPNVEVDRFNPTQLKLEVNPRIFRADSKNKELERTILEKQ